MKRPISCILLALGMVVPALPARALTIHATYDVSVTSLTNAAQVQAAFAAAAQAFQDRYTNPITVNITVYWGATGPFSGGISLGASITSLRSSSYSQVTNALRALRTSTSDMSSFASLPASDPTGAGPWWVPRAEAKALGLPGVGANDSTRDGDVGFASTVNYTFDPNNRSVPGKFDFIGVAQHEISELMGRIYGLNSGITGYVPYDLFRFTNNGARSLNAAASGVYLSTENGATQLKLFYTNASMGDVQDWATSGTPDAFDAFSSSGHILPLSAVDFISLDILGYNSTVVSAPILAGVKLSNGTFRISFTNAPGASFTIVSSTNASQSLTNWAVLGTATESPSGQYQYTDAQPATNKLRFYSVHFP